MKDSHKIVFSLTQSVMHAGLHLQHLCAKKTDISQHAAPGPPAASSSHTAKVGRRTTVSYLMMLHQFVEKLPHCPFVMKGCSALPYTM